MSRDPILFLEDILEAIGQIQQFIEGMDQDEFMRDQKTIHACMSCFQIVGEATKKLRITWKEEQPSIPWQQIQGFRNALAHEFSISMSESCGTPFRKTSAPSLPPANISRNGWPKRTRKTDEC